MAAERILDGQGNFLHYKKVCVHCHKTFTTTSRTQKYCSDECCKKRNKQKIESRKRYEKVKDFERIRVRAHSLAVATVELLEQIGARKHECAVCHCNENLELHHINLSFLDNTPENLVYLCKKHHAEAHSKLEKELNERGILLSEYYNKSMEPFFKVLNKNTQD